jgi:hypothetical protein
MSQTWLWLQLLASFETSLARRYRGPSWAELMRNFKQFSAKDTRARFARLKADGRILLIPDTIRVVQKTPAEYCGAAAALNFTRHAKSAGPGKNRTRLSLTKADRKLLREMGIAR